MSEPKGETWGECRLYVIEALKDIKNDVGLIKDSVTNLKEFKAKVIGMSIVASAGISIVVSIISALITSNLFAK